MGWVCEKYVLGSEGYASVAGKLALRAEEYAPGSGGYVPDSRIYATLSGVYVPLVKIYAPFAEKYDPQSEKYEPKPADMRLPRRYMRPSANISDLHQYIWSFSNPK